MDTDWQNVANNRINKEISGFRDIKSKEEYFEKLEDYLSASKSGQQLLNARTRSFSSIREEMYEGEASKVVEKNQSQLTDTQAEKQIYKDRAIRFERARGRAGQIDERRTARDTRVINKRNYLSWRKRPNRMDLRSIDSRKRRKRYVQNVIKVERPRPYVNLKTRTRKTPTKKK